MGYVHPSALSAAPAAPPYYPEIPAEYFAPPAHHAGIPVGTWGVMPTPPPAQPPTAPVTAPTSAPAPYPANPDTPDARAQSASHAPPSSPAESAAVEVQRLAARAPPPRGAEARAATSAMTPNFFVVDAPLLACAMFLSTVLTFVPSAMYANHPACENYVFVAEAFLLSFASAFATGLLTAAALAQRGAGRTLARAARADQCALHAPAPGVLRRRLKRASAISATAFMVSGFASAMAIGSVVARYGERAPDPECPREYADVVVAGALLMIISMVLVAVRQAARQCMLCGRARGDTRD